MLTLYIADVERDAGMKKLSREEAAKVLEGMKVKIEIPKAAVTQWERNAALDMAIEVLNCSEIPNKSDTISRQAALDAIMGQPPEPHYPSWYAAQIEKLPAAQPDHNADISEINKFIDGLEEILADIRERHVDDSVCGLCEYDGAYMGQSGDWCNECPGFDKDDCFKLSDETRKKWIEEIVNTYPDHTADIGKKVSISCGQENDMISRQAAIDSIAKQMPRSYTPDGSHPGDEEIFRAQEIYVDCIESIEILPAVQPDNQTNLCDSCDYSYPDCPSKYDDVIFGNGIGNDNICACNKYKPSAQPEQKKDEWIPISKETNPTKSGWYLVTVHEDATNDNERFTGMAEFNAINGMWYDIDEPTDMYLRWMPLPAPYRGGEMT